MIVITDEMAESSCNRVTAKFYSDSHTSCMKNIDLKVQEIIRFENTND